MESSTKEQEDNEYPIYFYIHLFFVFIGIIFYIFAIFSFKIYYNQSSFIKFEIFSSTPPNSFKSFLEIILSSSLTKELIVYIINIIDFYLILSYINRCFTSKKISQDSSNYEIKHFFLIIILFTICTFPYKNLLNISGKLIFLCNAINIILAIALFRYINIKMKNLLEYLNDKKMTNSSIPYLYLPYMKAHYYYTNFSTINIIFYLCAFCVISYHSIKILDSFFEWQIISRYLILFSEEFIYCSLIAAGLIFFYCLNKNKLVKGGKKTRRRDEEANLSKFSVIDVDIQQDEKANLSERKIPEDRKKREEKLSQEEDDDDEKTKTNNIKANEESESLK